MARILLSTDHVHRPRRRWFPPTADEEKEHGAVVGLVAQLYDAVLDKCAQCQQELLAHVAGDPSTAGVLVGWACLITSENYGELPWILLEGAERADAPFQPSAAFCSIAAEYDHCGLGPAGLYAFCGALSDDERLQAAETALEIVVGLDDFGLDFMFR
ncbi:hypothetical protein QIS99_31215 [Streptomyces sp. B-S-A8]|uniref:Uncharacterized protein n=1 Tax=Streptomyces solicavernae TaxID=3043614 RepID=A0ABT6S1R6_9ACTN|nr:hypothetical protein [Streptomyces sp. B-S-A8]MDI3390632.1 hypothetical protein [Streptomyces sp. B-S-A8]